MSQLPILCLKMQIQTFALQCEGLKEYEADWLKNAKTITRDASGRFASKVSDTKEVLKEVGEGLAITKDLVGNLIKDEAFRKRAGLTAGKVGAQIVENLARKVKADPKLVGQINQLQQEFANELAETYGDDKDPISQGFRKAGKFKFEGKNFKEQLEMAIAEYKACEEALESPENYSRRKEQLTNLAKAAVPVASIFALSLAPEIAMPLLAGKALYLGNAIASVAAGTAAYVATEKWLDAMDVENPIVRELVKLVAAGGVQGAASAGLSLVVKKQAEKKAAPFVAKEIDNFRQTFSKEVNSRFSKLNSGVDSVITTDAPDIVLKYLHLPLSKLSKIVKDLDIKGLPAFSEAIQKHGVEKKLAKISELSDDVDSWFVKMKKVTYDGLSIPMNEADSVINESLQEEYYSLSEAMTGALSEYAAALQNVHIDLSYDFGPKYFKKLTKK